MPKQVKIYSTPTCPFCQQAKRYLGSKGIAYENVDVASDAAARQEMINKSGQMGVPVILVDGELLVGFNQSKLDELLQE